MGANCPYGGTKIEVGFDANGNGQLDPAEVAVTMTTVALLVSDVLHDLGDGVAIAAAFSMDPAVGVMTAGAVMLHELPEEIADYALLRAAGVGRGRTLAALAAVQLTAGVGAAGTLLASELVASAQGTILAVACGMFVYIALFDLVPVLWRQRSLQAVTAAVVGATIAMLLGT